MPPPAAVTRLPPSPGVYRFRDGQGRVLYLGRAVQLRRRVGSYWSDLRDRAHLAPMVARIARIEAVACDSDHEAAWLERNLLETALPRWNRTPGGQEVPVYLRLDPGPGAPGLAVTHTPATRGPVLRTVPGRGAGAAGGRRAAPGTAAGVHRYRADR
jgi:excinuclease ABC subunit C